MEHDAHAIPAPIQMDAAVARPARREVLAADRRSGPVRHRGSRAMQRAGWRSWCAWGPPSARQRDTTPIHFRQMFGLDLRRQTKEAAAKVGAAKRVIKMLMTHTVRRRFVWAAPTVMVETPKRPTSMRAREPAISRGVGDVGQPGAIVYAVESREAEFVRFVNPEICVAHQSCGTSGCHSDVVLQVQSMMTHGCMLWERRCTTTRFPTQGSQIWRKL